MKFNRQNPNRKQAKRMLLHRKRILKSIKVYLNEKLLESHILIIEPEIEALELEIQKIKDSIAQLENYDLPKKVLSNSIPLSSELIEEYNK